MQHTIHSHLFDIMIVFIHSICLVCHLARMEMHDCVRDSISRGNNLTFDDVETTLEFEARQFLPSMLRHAEQWQRSRAKRNKKVKHWLCCHLWSMWIEGRYPRPTVSDNTEGKHLSFKQKVEILGDW